MCVWFWCPISLMTLNWLLFVRSYFFLCVCMKCELDIFRKQFHRAGNLNGITVTTTQITGDYFWEISMKYPQKKYKITDWLCEQKVWYNLAVDSTRLMLIYYHKFHKVFFFPLFKFPSRLFFLSRKNVNAIDKRWAFCCCCVWLWCLWMSQCRELFIQLDD